MAKTKTASSSKTTKKTRPALSPEARENQLINMAVDLAEQQLRDGTASSQVITHFLKLGTMKEQLEREKLMKENELLRARTESLTAAKNQEELYQKAIKAMQHYSGYDEEYDENIY